MATDPMLDPSDKFSIFRGTGNGSKTAWDFNFAGGYIRREHIKAYTSTGGGSYVPVLFTWLGPNTINITPAVPSGVELLIYRDTPKDRPLVDFNDGARIDEKNLDITAAQAVFAAAEMVDRFEEVSVDFETVTNTANTALSTANSALSAAGAAVSTANAANATASAADGKATTAMSNSASAVATANAASNDANAATGAANTATSTANSALSTANSADDKADQAIVTANSANDKADQATSTANTAANTAANASLSAGSALMTANAVREEFDDLSETVEALVGEDLSAFVRTNIQNNFTVRQDFTTAGFSGNITVGGNADVTGTLRVNGNTVYHAGNIAVTIPQVSGLQAALDGKQPVGSYAASSHTHAAGDITSGTFDAARIPTLVISKVSGLQGALDAKAPLNNPLFTSNVRTPNIQIVNDASQYRALTFMAGTAERWGHMTMPTNAGEDYYFYGGRNDGATFNVYSVERSTGTFRHQTNVDFQAAARAVGGIHIGDTAKNRHLHALSTDIVRLTVGGAVFDFYEASATLEVGRLRAKDGRIYFGASGTDGFAFYNNTMYLENSRNLSIGTGVLYAGATSITGNVALAGNVDMTDPTKRVHIGGVRQPSVHVQANDPGAANRHAGDLWVW